jgi:hypothetical protein
MFYISIDNNKMFITQRSLRLRGPFHQPRGRACSGIHCRYLLFGDSDPLIYFDQATWSTFRHSLGAADAARAAVICLAVITTGESERPTDSPRTAIVEVSGPRIKSYWDQSPYADKATDEQLAEYLVGEIGPHALARAGLHRSGRWCLLLQIAGDKATFSTSFCVSCRSKATT